jgi:predicted MFS family arabinose efflux permease
MKAGLAALIIGYVLSQFYRAFLAVLSPVLATDLGASSEILATASGYWFLAFAAMQIPVGSALDRIGPRFTASGLLGVAAVGAALFASATRPEVIKYAMLLIGIGCAPVLMASYYLFARLYSPAVFGTLAGVVIGIGSLGNIAASLPLSAAVDVLGWRGTMWALSALTALTALAILLLVRDPEAHASGSKGSVLDLLRMPALWPILIMMAACYAPAAGLRGLWAGPYLSDVFGADRAEIGRVTLVMGLAMVVGNFAYGPMERLLGSRKWLVFGGNALVVICLVTLANYPTAKGALPMILLAAIGLFGASFPIVMAHGRAFLPPHLTGRGVTLINLFGIGTTGVMQYATGRLHAALSPNPEIVNSAPPALPYVGIMLFYAGLTALGLLAYLWSKDRTD